MPPPFRIPRFYPILDTATVARRGLDPVRAAGEILEAGAQILQFRHKGHISREIFGMMQRIADLCRESGAIFVVNDRADLARILNAGVHLGQDDLPLSAVRGILGEGALAGVSTHNEAQLRAAAGEPAGYLALGPVFGTASKEHPDPVVGLEGLRRLRPLSPRPLVAIGGITRQNARAVIEAGADSVAVIGDVFPESGGLRTRIVEWVSLLAQD